MNNYKKKLSPPCLLTRGEDKILKKKKFDFIKKKENICNSLQEVECFLNNIKDISHEIYNYDDNGINKYHKYLSNQGVLKRNPMNNMFVYSLFNSSRLDFIYITNEYKIKSIKSHHLYDPEYKQWEGGGLNRVFPTENSIVGYLDLAVSANYVYALFCNRKRYEITNGDRTSSDVISVFDWNGNPVKQIKLPFEIFNLAVNE